MTDGKRFLVVDDDATIVEIVSRILEFKFGVVTVDMAANAEEALCHLNASQYDFLITDQLMPGKNGTTLISEARQLDPSLHVVLVTAYADTPLLKEIADIGGVDLVTKPFELEDILRVLPS